MTSLPGVRSNRKESPLAALNGRWHEAALAVFMFVVIAHWTEHIVQGVQIWVLDTPRPQARGVLGDFYPWLISSEWLHYGYAILMLIGLFLLRSGFTGRARRWWTIALAIQFWHHVEHLLLLIQAQTHTYFFGGSVPTSVAQVFFPRVELHLFYNSIVTIPMIVAMVLHRRPSQAERAASPCTCAVTPRQPAMAGR